MISVPRSKEFDDVYFSVADGLAETRHVFLDGNSLPERFAAGVTRDFTICETGFGTGLNFLAAYKLWQGFKNANKTHRMNFVSFEKYPLGIDFIEKSLAHWRDDIGAELDALARVYPRDLSDGVHEMDVADDVRLRLYFGDVNDVVPRIDDVAVDCWFLDGFKPSSNPEMWSETVFSNMARLSRENASFATFTSAGFVRRGLKAAGFDVRKVLGYGRKREMSVGRCLSK